LHGCGEEKKLGWEEGVQEKFFQKFRFIQKIFERERMYLQNFKKWEAQNFIFPTYDRFFK
jgi:hypothetical protein